jgi:hypothetical protein
MRRHQVHAAAAGDHAMKLFHGAHHVRDVFDYVHGAKRIEGVVAERVRKTVEVAQHVGAATRVAVDADRARIFVDATADVQGARRLALNAGSVRVYLRVDANCFRHSSSVSTAKSA